MNDVSILLAFSAGLLSFLSPCVLPLVPAYVSYLTGTSVYDLSFKKLKLNTLYKSFGFVLGFSLIFIVMGASATSLGKLIIKHQVIFRRVGGTVIIVFGLHTLGLFKIKLFYREKRFLPFNKSYGILGSVLMGIAFAAGWTPCIGPILSAILIYAASMQTISKGIFLLTVYSLGLAMPFILSAMLIESFLKHKSNLQKHFSIINFISGMLMIIMGILIFTNKMGVLSGYLNFLNF